MKYVKEDPTKYILPTITKGMEYLQEDQIALFADDIVLKGEYATNPSLFSGVKILPVLKHLYVSIVLTKNCPLKAAFKLAANQYFEDGHYHKTVGKKITYQSGSLTDTMVLKSGQVILILLQIGAGICLALLIFCSEIFHKMITQPRSSISAQPVKNSLYMIPPSNEI